MTKDELRANMSDRFARCLEISQRKNADYAGDGDPFRTFRMSTMVGVDPRRAILVRITDKLSRISRLLDHEAAVVDESLQDSIDDAINYLALLGALLDSER